MRSSLFLLGVWLLSSKSLADWGGVWNGSVKQCVQVDDGEIECEMDSNMLRLSIQIKNKKLDFSASGRIVMPKDMEVVGSEIFSQGKVIGAIGDDAIRFDFPTYTNGDYRADVLLLRDGRIFFRDVIEFNSGGFKVVDSVDGILVDEP